MDTNTPLAFTASFADQSPLTPIRFLAESSLPRFLTASSRLPIRFAANSPRTGKHERRKMSGFVGFCRILQDSAGFCGFSLLPHCLKNSFCIRFFQEGCKDLQGFARLSAYKEKASAAACLAVNASVSVRMPPASASTASVVQTLTKRRNGWKGRF